MKIKSIAGLLIVFGLLLNFSVALAQFGGDAFSAGDTGTQIRVMPGKQYVVDMRRKDVFYNIDLSAPSIDLARVLIKTGTGTLTLSSWLKERFPNLAGKQPTRVVVTGGLATPGMINWLKKENNSDSSTASGVNTAGTVRVNNLANLEALLDTNKTGAATCVMVGKELQCKRDEK